MLGTTIDFRVSFGAPILSTSPTMATAVAEKAASFIAGDDHNLAITGLVTIGMQLFFFAIAYTLNFDKVTDFAGSSNFILIALLTFFSQTTYAPRAIMITALVCIARLELAGFLLYRVLKRGKDDRFDNIREKFLAFLVFWIFQMLWAWGVSLPVTFANSDIAVSVPFEARDWAGLAMFIVGFVIQVVADFQKDAFRADPANRRRVCNVGVWSISRHPNFFGEMLLWWGIWTICTPVFAASSATWGYATIFGPILTMVILLFGSGMPTAEGDYQKRFMQTAEAKAAYLAYRERTSPLIPLPPSVYVRLPLVIKRVFFFEWKIYETDWSYVGDDLQKGLKQKNSN